MHSRHLRFAIFSPCITNFRSWQLEFLLLNQWHVELSTYTAFPFPILFELFWLTDIKFNTNRSSNGETYLRGGELMTKTVAKGTWPNVVSTVLTEAVLSWWPKDIIWLKLESLGCSLTISSFWWERTFLFVPHTGYKEFFHIIFTWDWKPWMLYLNIHY